MTMLPGQPARRPAPITAAWRPPPRPQMPAQPRITPVRYERTPAQITPPAAPPRGAGARFLRGNAKVIAVVIGMTLTLLTMIDGLGFVPQDARDIVAVMLAGLTPIAVYFLPDKKEGSHGN